MVNKHPITALREDFRKLTVVAPALLLVSGFDPYTLVGIAHDHLSWDYEFIAAQAERFWKDWVVFYLLTLQSRNKWQEAAYYLQVNELVSVGDVEDIS